MENHNQCTSTKEDAAAAADSDIGTVAVTTNEINIPPSLLKRVFLHSYLLRRRTGRYTVEKDSSDSNDPNAQSRVYQYNTQMCVFESQSGGGPAVILDLLIKHACEHSWKRGLDDISFRRKAVFEKVVEGEMLRMN